MTKNQRSRNESEDKKPKRKSRFLKNLEYSLLGIGIFAVGTLCLLKGSGAIYKNTQKKYQQNIKNIKQEYVISAYHSHTNYSKNPSNPELSDTETTLDEIVTGHYQMVMIFGQ